MTLFKHLRTCVITKKKEQQNQLIRITKIENSWQLNVENKYQGRSIYLIKDKQVIEQLLTNKRKIRYFELNEKLIQELENYAQNL